MIRARQFALALAVFSAAGVGCKPSPSEDPDAVYAEVTSLLEQGAPDQALQALQSAELSDTEMGQSLWLRIQVARRDFAPIFERITAPSALDADDRVLYEDACFFGAVDALDGPDGAADHTPDPALARTRIAHCDGTERIDLVAARFRLLEATPSDEEITAILTALENADEGQELDVAAHVVESAFVAFANQAAEASQPVVAAYMWKHAFEVGQNPEFAPHVRQAFFDAGTAVVDTDAQQAVTLFEHLYSARIEGLERDEEMEAQAREASREALFPTFLLNSRNRYARKFQDEDVAAGVLDVETMTFTHDISTDEAYEAFLAWNFERQERPRPRPTPDALAWSGLCEDRSVPCQFTYEQLTRMAYDQAQIEAEYLEANDLEAFTWSSP